MLLAHSDNSDLDHRQCYAAIQAHDARFDGLFFVAVASTRVYCRPICRVRLPRPENCSFFPSAASAEQAGYRPCLRCRPELAPGLAKMDAVQRVARQAAERIRAGALVDSDLEALAGEFAISSRQLRRVIEAEYGVSPIALALTHRLHLAKQLLSDTSLKMVDIAFASGFSSVRRFNDAFRRHYRMSPSDLRRGRPARPDSAKSFPLRLGYRPPLAWETLGNFLASRGNQRVEAWDAGRYLRVVTLDGCSGWIAAHNDETRAQIVVEVSHSLLPCLPQLQSRLRALFDLDANPAIIDRHLSQDPLLAERIQQRPGLRIPGSLDIFELCLRAILGQQVSVKAASTLYGRFVAAFGAAVETPFPGLDRSAPSAPSIAAAALQDIIDLGLTGKRAATVHNLAQLVANGELQLAAMDHQQVLKRLLALPGIGPWTAQYVAMRALADPNALPESDLGLMRALQVDKSAQVLARAENWQPWRAYAAMHLWCGGAGQQSNAGG